MSFRSRNRMNRLLKKLVSATKGIEKSKPTTKESNAILTRPSPKPKADLTKVAKQAIAMIAKTISIDIELRLFPRQIVIYFLNQLIAYSQKQEKIISNDVQAAVDYILENIYETISLDVLAEVSGLSLSRFKQKFCQQLGFTPREYINFHKVEASKTLLEKGKNVTDAAIELGFSTPNYYSSVFKRFTTLSPSEYLKSLK